MISHRGLQLTLVAVLLAMGSAQHALAQDTEFTGPLLADFSVPSYSSFPSEENDADKVQQVSLTTVTEVNAPHGAAYYDDAQDLRFIDWWKVAPSMRQVAIGLNGAAGDSETLDLVGGYDAKREWGRYSGFTDLDYFYSRANVATTKNRLYSLSRFERAIVGTPYSWFVDGWFEYDQFKPYDVRVASHAGLIRTFIKSDRQLLRGLAGFGAAKTYGGVAESDWKAEPEFGALYELKINPRQKFYVSALYYPELTDPSFFRLNIKAGYEIKLSDTRDIALRLWVFNRYDNTDLTIVAPDTNPNALDYAASIVWGFN